MLLDPRRFRAPFIRPEEAWATVCMAHAARGDLPQGEETGVGVPVCRFAFRNLALFPAARSGRKRDLRCGRTGPARRRKAVHACREMEKTEVV